jgi:hypothetical protein
MRFPKEPSETEKGGDDGKKEYEKDEAVGNEAEEEETQT